MRKTFSSAWLRTWPACVSLVLVLSASGAWAQTPSSATPLTAPAPAADTSVPALLSAATRASVDQAATKALADTGVPGASVAVVKDAEIAYAEAYGDARIDPPLAARPDMRYSIGSISKQFTATAVLMLAEEGKLSLDDHVSRFLPDLTRANEVTLRELLSQTSGYSDYWPQDYVPPMMLRPVSAEEILKLWADKPLDFDPGTKWQYSNTNYVIAGLIIEKVSGMPLLQFLQTRIFAPLGMQSVLNVDRSRLGDTDATGYLRYALGPPRPAPKEGAGWLFAMGELAMTASDLAKWDISIINQSLLKPASYKEMETEVKLKDGGSTSYGLGVFVTRMSGHRVIAHSGEVSGFVSDNLIFPDDRAAVAVLTNEDASAAASMIAHAVGPLLISGEDASAARDQEQALAIFKGLQHGKIDRSLFTDNANSYFTPQALSDFASSLGPLGEPREFTQSGGDNRGGMTYLHYTAKFPNKTLAVSIYKMPDGKIEQYLVMPQE